MGDKNFERCISRGLKLSLAAILILPSMPYAAEKRPLIPGYLPERGEIFSSIGLGYSEGNSSASGTGVFAGQSSRSRFSSTGIGIGLVYGVSDNIKALLGLTHIASVKLKGDGADSADAPTGWTSPDFGLLRVFDLESQASVEVGLRYRPKIDSSPLRNYSAGALSVNYSRYLNKGLWVSGVLAHGAYEGDTPDSYSLGVGVAGALSSITMAASLILTRFDDQTSQDGFTRQNPKTSPAFAMSLSGPVSRGTHWGISLSHTRSKSIIHHLTELGTAISKQESTSATVSLLKEF